MAINDQANKSGKSYRLIIVALIAVCLLIYGQVIGFQFINFDDNLYVYDNPFVLAGLTGRSFRWAFTTFHSANWHPLTWASHMIDASLFGANPSGHHIVNLIFHAANSVLAFVIFRRFTGDLWKSAMVAFLFAVHPAHVESVAWVSERKDVLSTLFWLLTMLAYFRFAREEESLAKRMLSGGYVLVVVCFALGLMSKPMLVTLPFVLLLCDYWPLARLKSLKDLVPLVLEKLPLFVLSGISAYVTIRAQAAYGAIQSTQMLPLDMRLSNALVSYVKYIVMLLYPANLGMGYAYDYSLPAWQIRGSVLLLALITAFCVWQRRNRKYLIVGWLWFVGTLIPVIGIVQVGSQSMADRYTYVPYFGLFIILVWGVAEFVPKLRLNFSSTVVVAAIPIAVLSFLAFNQTSYWQNSIKLYSHTLNAGQGNFLTMHNLCSALTGQNRFAEAEVQCLNSIQADPGFPESHVLLGVVSLKLGKYDVSIAEFRRAMELNPNDAMAYGNIAAPLAMTGKTDEAEQSLNKAVELYRQSGVNPAPLSSSYSNLAAVFAQQNRFDKAAVLLEQALAFAPDRPDARANYALSLYFLDRLYEAKTEIDKSIGQNPNLAESHNIRGMILLKQNDRAGAIAAFERALQLKPDFKDAKDNLERANAGR